MGHTVTLLCLYEYQDHRTICNAGEERVVGMEEAQRLLRTGRFTVITEVLPTAPAIDATESAIELANEHGIQLEDVRGTGTGGRITKADVQALLSKET